MYKLGTIVECKAKDEQEKELPSFYGRIIGMGLNGESMTYQVMSAGRVLTCNDDDIVQVYVKTRSKKVNPKAVHL